MKTMGAFLFAALFCAAIPAGAAGTLRLAGRAELPGYTGDLDHFAYDLQSRTLWLAAEDHGTLDVFDLDTGALRESLGGVVGTPHAVHYEPRKQRLIVTDSGGQAMATKVIGRGAPRIFRLAAPAADAMTFDASTGRLYVANGGRDAKLHKTWVSAFDPRTLKRFGDVAFDSDKVEGMAAEQKGNRLFVNVTGRNEIAVLDKRNLHLLATWPIAGAAENAPMAFDEKHGRLFVITRKPWRMMVLAADTGATVASFAAPAKCDQVIWDAANRRIYAPGGEGFIAVYRQDDASHYSELERVPTAPGAKTGILVPELKRLFVAVSPGEAKTGAALLRFDVAPAQPFSILTFGPRK